MGALAGRLGRHRSRIAGAAGLIVALAAPAAAQAGPTLVSWKRVGGLAPMAQPSMKILKDRTIRATGEDAVRLAADSARFLGPTHGRLAHPELAGELPITGRPIHTSARKSSRKSLILIVFSACYFRDEERSLDYQSCRCGARR